MLSVELVVKAERRTERGGGLRVIAHQAIKTGCSIKHVPQMLYHAHLLSSRCDIVQNCAFHKITELHLLGLDRIMSITLANSFNLDVCYSLDPKRGFGYIM